MYPLHVSCMEANTACAQRGGVEDGVAVALDGEKVEAVGGIQPRALGQRAASRHRALDSDGGACRGEHVLVGGVDDAGAATGGAGEGERAGGRSLPGGAR